MPDDRGAALRAEFLALTDAERHYVLHGGPRPTEPEPAEYAEDVARREARSLTPAEAADYIARLTRGEVSERTRRFLDAIRAEWEPCERCHGTGEVDFQIGGDGYGDRCCGLADVPGVCPECEGATVTPTG